MPSGPIYSVRDMLADPHFQARGLFESVQVDGREITPMLETFGVEPVPADWPLLQLPNVTLTPHIAGASVRTVTFAAEQTAEEVRRYIAGEPPRNPC